MPIFNFKISQGNWKIVSTVNRKDFYKLIKIFKSSYNSFAFKDDKMLTAFRKSFTQFEDYEKGIFSYDCNKTGINPYTYQLMLDAMINETNYYLSLPKNAKFKDYKFDIVGDFNVGRVILMKRQK